MRPHTLLTALIAVALGWPVTADQASPVVVVDTVKGPFEIELFAADAPKSVEHLVALVGKGFYRGLRIHRASASLVQFGDPQTRNMTLRNRWGSSGSGQVIGVAEISGRTHVRGTVALAHAGTPEYADSQIYIMKTAGPSLDGKHTIVGRVTTGMAVVDQLDVPDVVRGVTLKEAARR